MGQMIGKQGRCRIAVDVRCLTLNLLRGFGGPGRASSTVLRSV